MMDDSTRTIASTASQHGPSGHRSSLACLIISALLVALTLFWLLKARWSVGRDGWFIKPNEGAWPLPAWWLPLAVLFLFGGLAAISVYDRFKRAKSRRDQNNSTILAVIGLSLLALLWPWSLLGPLGTANLINSAWSDVANEYFATAYQVEDARRFTAEYPMRHQQPTSPLQAHVATHPPGAVLFYYVARRIFEAAPPLQNGFKALGQRLSGESIKSLAQEARALRETGARVAGNKETPQALPDSAIAGAIWCAFLISLIVACTVPVVYWLGSGGAASTAGERAGEARGLVCAAFFVLAPTVQLFNFTLDALIACGAVWMLACLARYLSGGKAGWLLLAGALLALTNFLSFGALAGGVIAALALALSCRGTDLPKRSLLVDLALLAAGFVALWMLLLVLLPMQPLAIFTNAMAAHQLATLKSRDYWGWAGLNFLTFALFIGWPVVVAVVAQIVRARRTKGRPWREYCALLREPPIAIGWATVLTMIALSFSGNVRGEVERLWLFLLPPLCAFAVSGFQRVETKTAYTWGGLLILQAVQTLFMAATLAPLVRPF
ncbi:MAG TPA: hypothetical protein VNA16_03230 [Abditibacteriaceae bacterium]|nr:hypothetical protein [Abditibacteriaceae bacterium]